MRRKWIPAVLAIVVGIAFLCSYPASGKNSGRGSDRVLSKVTFIHFKRGHGKPAGTPGKGGGNKEEEGHYTYISKGARWKTVEDLVLNPANGEDVGEADVVGAVQAGMHEWETPGDTTLDIIGDLLVDETVAYDGGAFREFNTISFASYGAPGVIAVTTVWGYFNAPPPMREIIEVHILFNDDYEWGDASADDALMDIQNIATHELGHVAGMGDLYQTEASEETMYGYSTEGELKKRDLYYGDVTGITKLYK